MYARCALGMPGSETELKELMSRVLGDLLYGFVAKIADDLYCGGESPKQLLGNWQRVFHAFRECNLTLSASKTIIVPAQNLNARVGLDPRHDGQPTPHC